MKMRFSARSLVIIFLLVLVAGRSVAQEKLNLQMVDRIRREGLENSKLAEFLSTLCDVHGPRLPASVGAAEAAASDDVTTDATP